MKSKISLRNIIRNRILYLVVVCMAAACGQVQLFEQIRNIPGGTWDAGEPLAFGIQVPDTATSYRIFLTIRHTNLYPYRNIWVRLGVQQPGADSINYQDFDLPLAGNESWLGVGMNDVYDRRVQLFGRPVRFSKSGEVRFTMQQIMRDKELAGILQAGIRIEPVPSGN